MVVTSDHGDLLGERGQYMHVSTADVAHRKLQEVPWFVVDPATTGTEPTEAETSYLEGNADRTDVADAEVEERLAQLRYK